MTESYSKTKITPYEFWNKIGCPKTIVAPMVDHCDLAYRMQCRKYGILIYWLLCIVFICIKVTIK